MRWFRIERRLRRGGGLLTVTRAPGPRPREAAHEVVELWFRRLGSPLRRCRLLRPALGGGDSRRRRSLPGGAVGGDQGAPGIAERPPCGGGRLRGELGDAAR